MAIPTKPYATVQQNVTSAFRVRFPGKALGPTRFLGKQASAVGMALYGIQKAIEDADKDGVPTSEMSSDALDSWANTLGLDNGDGGYGRHVAIAATGGAATLTGTKGTAYIAGTLATAEDGTTQIELVANVTIAGAAPGTGSVAGTFVAVTAGAAGNLEAGTVCTWESPPAGADSTFTLTTGLSGGEDTETNAALLGRIQNRLRNPPKGGTANDYRTWAESQDGVDRAYVYPLRSGTGTVDVVIAKDGENSARVPPGATQTAVQDYINEVRPVTVNAAAVRLVDTTSGVTVRVRVDPASDAYDFDWIDTAGFTVAAWAAGPPAVLTLSADAPASLVAAIDDYLAGTATAPRIQIRVTNGSVSPVQVRAVNYGGAGNRQLTLENPLPDDFTVTPTNGDVVYAGGPVVDTICADLQELVDSLGPSRASGYADPNDAWNDTLSISGLIDAAMDSVDTDGTRLIKSVLVNGATINAVEADFTGSDNLGTAPQIVVAKWINVTQ